MRVDTIFNNFSRGKIDHDLNGRFDLPIYQTGADVFRNFFSTFKGTAVYRQGWERMLDVGDSAFYEFKFSETLSYLMVFGNLTLKFAAFDSNGNFGFIQSGGGDLVVVTPYTIAQAKELVNGGIAQTGDLCYIVHPAHAPRKLVRVSANSFTLNTYTRTADPFGSATNYPRGIELYQGAAYFVSTIAERTTIWRSKAGDFEDFTVGVNDDDGFKITVSGLTESIDWIAQSPSQNGLVSGSARTLITISGDSRGAITPSNVKVDLSGITGSHTTRPIKKDNLLFYITNNQRNLQYFNYDLIQESFIAKDSNLASYDITNGGMSKLAYKRDRNDLIYTIRNNRHLLSLNFNEAEQIVGWHEHESVCDVKDIATINSNTGDAVLFGLLKFGANFYICRMSDNIEYPLFDKFYTGDKDADIKAFILYIAERLKLENHLDLSVSVERYYTSTITYDEVDEIVSTGADFTAEDVDNIIIYRTETGREEGRFLITEYIDANTVKVEVVVEPTSLAYNSWYKTFKEVTGLNIYNDTTVSVVADGGYLGDYLVADNKIDLGRQVSKAIIGYKYTGLIKTFPLGFPTETGTNTQTTPKAIVKSYMRCVTSAGGEVGSDLYNMIAVQLWKLDGFYDLPPLPIDNTSDAVLYSDDYENDKCIYIRQSSPLPLRVSCLFTEVQYGMGR